MPYSPAAEKSYEELLKRIKTDNEEKLRQKSRWLWYLYLVKDRILMPLLLFSGCLIAVLVPISLVAAIVYLIFHIVRLIIGYL